MCLFEVCAQQNHKLFPLHDVSIQVWLSKQYGVTSASTHCSDMVYKAETRSNEPFSNLTRSRIRLVHLQQSRIPPPTHRHLVHAGRQLPFVNITQYRQILVAITNTIVIETKKAALGVLILIFLWNPSIQ